MIFNTISGYLRIICIFWLIKCFKQEEFLSPKNDKDVSTEIITSDNETLQLKIRWKLNITNENHLDFVIIPHPMEHCNPKRCKEYGVGKNITEIIMPQDPMLIIEHKECSIELGCIYTVKISSTNGRYNKNITIEIPDCINGMCSCRHEKDLPDTHVKAEVLTSNSINITWNIYPKNNVGIKNQTNDIKLSSIFISIGQRTNKLFGFGSQLANLNETFYPLNLPNNYNRSQIIEGHTKFNTKRSLLPGSQFYIHAYVVDINNCRGSESHFTLIVPMNQENQNGNEVRKSPETFHSQIFTTILPIILLSFGGICIAHYIYKNIRKVNPASNWRSIYHQTPTGNPLPISMEENLLYTDKDVLEAQEKGKADIFEIPQNSIIIEYEVGKGAFGRVFKAIAMNLFRTSGSTIVAVKKLKKRPTPDEVEEFLCEIQTMKYVGRHENVISLLGCCTIKEPLMMIMEYVGHGDLLQYLRNVRRKHMEIYGRSQILDSPDSFLMNPLLAPQGKYLELRLSTTSGTSEGSYITQPDNNLRPSVTETMYTMLSNSNQSNESKTLDYVLDSKELQNFAIQIARGMHHLEQKGITHRDLAARNILIDERKTLKISDFGLSRNGIYVNTRNKKLPLRWLSIEAIRDNFYSSQSDVWAFAIVLWEIGTLGGFPYPTVSNHELLSFLSSGKRLEKPEICTEQLYQLMLNCWNEEPENRPSFQEILKWLQPQSQTKIYVDFGSLGSDYVFPPTKEQVLENNLKS